MSIDAGKLEQIQDEAFKLRSSPDAANEARKYIQDHAELFKDSVYLTDFALQLEENGVLPGVDFRTVAGVPSGVLTREQLQQLSSDGTIDPLFRAFAALADAQYNNLLSADGKFRVSEAVDKLAQLQPQFACVSLAQSLTRTVDGGTKTLFSLIDGAYNNGSTDGLLGDYDLGAVIEALERNPPDAIWQSRLIEAGVTLAQLKDWKAHYPDPQYAVLRENGGSGYVTLDTLRNAGYDSTTGTVTITDQNGLKISFLTDGTSSTLAPDGAITITHLDHTSERHLPGGAIQYLDAQGVLQKIDANNWITTYEVGSNGLQASQLDSKDGTLTWRYDGQGWRLHNVAQLNAALSETDAVRRATAYTNSVVGDPNVYMDLMNYKPEQASDPAGIVFSSNSGAPSYLRIKYQTDGTIEEKLNGFSVLIPGGDVTKEQLTLNDGSVWKMQDGVFKHFDKNNNLIVTDRALASTPEFDLSHNTLLLRYADNSSKLIKADGSMVRTLADGSVVEVGPDLKIATLTYEGNKYSINNDSSLQTVEMADHTQWQHVGDRWVHLNTDGTTMPDSSQGPAIPFQLNHGVVIFSTGTPPAIRSVIHPNGESTTFSYATTADGAIVSPTQLTAVVDSTGRSMELRSDGNWHFINADGTENHREGFESLSVSVDGLGNVRAVGREDEYDVIPQDIHFMADGRTIESTNSEVTSISYPDGTSELFQWYDSGYGMLGHVNQFTDRTGHVWDHNPTSSDYGMLDSQVVSSDGRIITSNGGHPEQVTFLDGHVYGRQSDQGFVAPDGATYYLRDGVWKTAEGVEPAKQADYIQLDANGGIAIAVKNGASLEIRNYYPNGRMLQTTSPISLDADSARAVAQSIKNDSSKLIPELTMLSIADRLAVDAQYFELTGHQQHLLDSTDFYYGAVDRATVEGLLYVTGELQDGNVRNNVMELREIMANTGMFEGNPQIAQQQIVYLLGSSTAAQIQQYRAEYRDRYGSDFVDDFANAPGISDAFREALPTLLKGIDGMRAGSANNSYMNDASFNALKDVALKYNDVQLFSLAFQYASPEQRDAYKNSPDGLPKLGDHFWGDDLADAQGYATIGSISLHRLVTKNTRFLFIDTDRILSDLVLNTTDKERQMYKLGKEISQISGFDLANPGVANQALAAQINEFIAKYPDVKFDDIKSFYATTYEDLRRASWPSQQLLALPGQDPAQPTVVAKFEDYLINGGPSLISSIIEEQKWSGGNYYDSNAVLSKIENMSFDDWNRLKDDDYYNALLASMHLILKDGDNSIFARNYSRYYGYIGPNYTQGDDFAIAKRLIDEKRALALKTDGTAEDNYRLSQGVGMRTSLEVFHENPPPRNPDSIARIISHLYDMPLSEMVMLRDANPDYLNQVKAAVDTLPGDAKSLALIIINHITGLSADDFAKLSSNPVAGSSSESPATSNQTNSIPLTAAQQLTFDTLTKASDAQLAIDRAAVEQTRLIETLAASNMSKPDLFTAVVALSKTDRLALLQDMENPQGPQHYSSLLNKFSPQEQEVLKHILNRLKDEDSPGMTGHLPVFDAVETMRFYTLQIAGDPASIISLLHSLDGPEGAEGDKTAKIRMVLDYNQSFHSDVFADALNIAGSGWRDRMVGALTIRPETWKDLANDAVFESLMSETGFAAFTLWNGALQGMEAQRDKLLRDLVDWETTGSGDPKAFQTDLDNFQAAMVSYVEAKRAFTQNALFLASIVLTLPVGAGLSIAGKLAVVGIASLLQVAGMKAGMGNDYNFSTDAVPDLLHGAANMTMLVVGGAIADRLLSRLIAPGLLPLVSAEAAPLLRQGLPALVGAIENHAGEAVISAAARDIAIKILGRDAAETAIQEMTATLVKGATDGLRGLTLTQRGMVVAASMELAGLPAHTAATIGGSIWDNLRSNKAIDHIISEALEAGTNSLGPTAGAILLGVGLSVLMEAVSSRLAARSGSSNAEGGGSATEGGGNGNSQTSIRDFIRTQLAAGLNNIELLLQQAGDSLAPAQRVAMVKAEFIRLLEQVDDLLMGKSGLTLAFEGVPTDSASPTRPGASTNSSGDPISPANGRPGQPSVDGDQPPLIDGDQPPLVDGDQPPPVTKPGGTGDQPVTVTDTSGTTPATSSASTTPINKMTVPEMEALAAQTKVNISTLEQLARAANAAAAPTSGMTIDQVNAGKILSSKPIAEMTLGELDVVAAGTGIPIETLKGLALGIEVNPAVPIDTVVPSSSAAPVDPAAPATVQLSPDFRQRLLDLGKQGIQRLFVEPAVELGTGTRSFAFKAWKLGYQTVIVVGVGTLVVKLITSLASGGGDGGHDAPPANTNGPTGPTGLDLGDSNQGFPPQANTTINVINYIDTPEERKKLLLDLTPDSAAGHFYRDTANNVHRYITSDDLIAAQNDPAVRSRLAADGFDPDAVLNWLSDPTNWAQLYDSNRSVGGQTVIDEDSLAAYVNKIPK